MGIKIYSMDEKREFVAKTGKTEHQMLTNMPKKQTNYTDRALFKI